MTVGRVMRMAPAEDVALQHMLSQVRNTGKSRAYFLSCAWSWWFTGDPALRNHFECAAGLIDGGYAS